MTLDMKHKKTKNVKSNLVKVYQKSLANGEESFETRLANSQTGNEAKNDSTVDSAIFHLDGLD